MSALRRLAAFLIRSPDAPFILSDLDEIMEKEMSSGVPRWRARVRYLQNAVGSAVSVRGRGSRSHGSGGFSWLDVKLGFRMLAKYPGMTVVGGLAIAFSIWCGASFFEFVTQVIRPDLGLEDDDRMVGIQVWDARASQPVAPLIFDYARWRGEIRSIEELGLFQSSERNLTVNDGYAVPVVVADLTASAFRLARVEPLLGRALAESDESPGAPAVMLIGYDLWQGRFQGAPDIVGRSVRLGRDFTTVIGVMPEGFRYPLAQQAWVPLKLNPLDFGPDLGRMRVIGRLAQGVSLRQAQVELSSSGERAAALYPETHATMRPQVRRYAAYMMGLPNIYAVGLAGTNIFVLMLLALVCGNVALLMFARAATRESELVVRSALGASRRRIVLQLFTEALVLGGLGAVIGLAGASYGLRLLIGVVQDEFFAGGARLPFWIRDSLSPTTVIYVGLLTVLGAVVCGVLPALKVTGLGVEARLRQSAAGGRPLRFGGVWTAVIVSQVAVTVAFPSTAFYLRRDLVKLRAYDFGFPAEEYLSVRLQMDRIAHADEVLETQQELMARFQAAALELESRLEAELGVSGAAFTNELPGSYHESVQVEVDQGAVAPGNGRAGLMSGTAVVDPGYFDVLGVSVVAGRGFHSGDVESSQRVVIVNQSFVEQVLGGQNAIGRRLRYVAFEDDSRQAEYDSRQAEPEWHEIVGVVPDLGVQNGYGSKGVYHPARAGDLYPVNLAVHVPGGAESFGPRLRSIATAVDPTLRLNSMMRMDEARAADVEFYMFWYRLAVFVSWIALFLALAGIYAVMAFTVSRRTREIGIRVALGSDSGRVALAIFRWPLIQVGMGVALGMAWTAFLTNVMRAGSVDGGVGGPIPFTSVALLGAYAVLMLGLCLLACVVPTRRALSVEPTEALRADV